MAYKKRDAPQPPPMDPAIPVAALLSLGLGLALLLSVGADGSRKDASQKPAPSPEQQRADHPLAFPPLEIDGDKLRRQRRIKYGQARRQLQEAGQDYQTLLDRVREANAAQFRALDTQEADQLRAEISVGANAVIPYTTYEHFPAAGRPVYRDCQKGLERLLGDVADGALTLEAAIESPSGARYRLYRRNCGKLLGELVERGLVTGEGRWAVPAEHSQALAELLMRVRWAHIIRDRARPYDQLTDYGLRVFLRWRIETPGAFPMEKRRLFLEKLRDDPALLAGYDLKLAAARLSWAAGNRREAVRHLREAIATHPERTEEYREALDWLKRRTGKKEKTG